MSRIFCLEVVTFKNNLSLAPDSAALVICSCELLLKESHEEEKNNRGKLATHVLIQLFTVQMQLNLKEMLLIRFASFGQCFGGNRDAAQFA